MTSELRPAVEVWWKATDAWKEGLSPEDATQSAAAVIEADREAVRAEQAAELAKFKALAETLATDLRECARALQGLRQIPGTGADGRLWQRIKEITDAAHAAVAQYKEATQ